MTKYLISRIPQQLLMLAGFVLMTASVSTSHAQSFEGKNINSVSVRYNGARTVDEGRIRGFM